MDGAVRRVEGGWVSTGQSWQRDTERYERITEARLTEQEAMLEYIDTPGCRLEFLRRKLDDVSAVPCGRCDNCSGDSLSNIVSPDTLQELRAYLDCAGIPISPRLVWPTGLPVIGVNLKGRIAASESAVPGRAIACLSDIGWGEQLRELLDSADADTPTPNIVLRRACQVLHDWAKSGGPRVTAVVAIQSRRRKTIVGTLAHSLAQATGCPFLGELAIVERPAKTGDSNSARRVAALFEKFRLSPQLASVCRTSAASILLVDDLIDSGWTMTLAARTLRQAGAVSVVPFALATTA